MKFFKSQEAPKYTKDNLREWRVATPGGSIVTVKAHTREVCDGALLLNDETNGSHTAVALFAPGYWTHLTAEPLPTQVSQP